MEVRRDSMEQMEFCGQGILSLFGRQHGGLGVVFFFLREDELSFGKWVCYRA